MNAPDVADATPKEANVSAALIAFAANVHTHAVGAGVMLLRDLANMMQEEAKRDEPIQPGEVSGWVQRLDFLGNAMSGANDELIESLHKHGFEAPGTDGSVVWRDE